MTSTAVIIKEEEKEIDYKTVGDIKPPYSYASLICMAMKTNQHKMTLSSIYKWIKENFLYYRNADPSWQINFRRKIILLRCYIIISIGLDWLLIGPKVKLSVISRVDVVCDLCIR